MNEMTLEEFVRPVSAALGRTCVPDTAVGRPGAGLGMRRERFSSLSTEELAAWFAREAAAIGVEVLEAEPETLADVVVSQVRAFGGGLVAYADDERADACGLAQALTSAGVESVRWDASRGEESIAVCERAAVGVTFPFAGIARTATVAQSCDGRCGRAVSLLPPSHISVVSKSTLVPRMIDVLERLDTGIAADGGVPADLPSSIVFITGPSATADIELVRVVGVHGPVQTAVVLVNN